MKKNGFTLVELISVLVILAVIALITVPALLNVIKDSKQKAYDRNITMIKIAMENWKNKNSSLLPKKGEKIYLTISELKHESFLDQTLMNPLTELPFPNDMLLTISNDNAGYQYFIDVNSGTDTDNYEGPTPYLISDMPIKRVLNVGDTYSYANVYAYKGDGTEDNVEINKSVIGGGNVSTAAPGKYHVLYKATIDDIPVALVETVIVESSDYVCTPVTVMSSGTYTIGDIYSCDPGDGTNRTFYVLSNMNESVSLIMDRNLGGNVAWNADNKLEEGPVTALAYLHNATMNWINVSTYLPEATTLAFVSNYTGWTPASPSNVLAGWLHNNINCRVNTCTEQVNVNEDGTTLGYWTTTPFENGKAYQVHMSGKLETEHVITDDNYYGVRPVIVVSKDRINN